MFEKTPRWRRQRGVSTLRFWQRPKRSPPPSRPLPLHPRYSNHPPTPLSPAAAGLEADDFLLHFDSAPDFIAYLDDIETAAADFSPLRDAGF